MRRNLIEVENHMKPEIEKDRLIRSGNLKKISYIFIIFLIESLIFSIGSGGKFVQPVNLLNASVQAAVIVLIALGQMYVITTAGIDLSIGSNIGLAGFMAAKAIVFWHVPIGIGILIGVGSATAVGLLNGIFIVYLQITPFIVTFVMQCIARGVTYIMLGEKSSVFGLPQSFLFLGSGSFLGIPMPIYIVVAIAAIFSIIITKTRTGRYIYAVGSNAEAARLSGVNINFTLIKVYVISGFLAGVTGIIAAARLGAATATSGTNAELDAVAATVIGGTSLMGGEGLPIATIIGALIVGVLSNGLTLMGVSGNLQLIAKGVVVLIAAALDIFKKSDKFKQLFSKIVTEK